MPTKPKKQRRQTNQGFTLLELLVVVAIIGIIASIAIPRYYQYIDKAKITVAVATLDTTRKVIEDYFNEYSNYPATIDFTTGKDGFGRTVFPSILTADLQKDFASIDSYVPTTDSYTLTARANNSAQTVVILTPQTITY
jgi:general secretion pathway protein G